MLAAISCEQTISSSYLPVCRTTLSADSLHQKGDHIRDTHPVLRSKHRLFTSCYTLRNQHQTLNQQLCLELFKAHLQAITQSPDPEVLDGCKISTEAGLCFCNEVDEILKLCPKKPQHFLHWHGDILPRSQPPHPQPSEQQPGHQDTLQQLSHFANREELGIPISVTKCSDPGYDAL